MENYMNDEEQEIDLRELFFALKKRRCRFWRWDCYADAWHAWVQNCL